MVYHGENAVRADQKPLTWMGCSGDNTTQRQNMIIRDFHAGHPYTGPLIKNIVWKVSFAQVYDHLKQKQVERKMQLMRYTYGGEGCLLLDRDEAGRTSSIRPGRNVRLPGPVTTAAEAAEATKFYPHQEYKIMEAAMICGPGFPLPNPESIVGNQRFCNVLGTPEILQNILSNLCYTDRASLSQSCRLAAVGVSNFQALWSINAEDLGDAEFQHEEFEHLIQAGEMWDVSAPRGAKVLMVTMTACEYQASNGYRPHSTYMKIASGMLRFFRAMDLRGCYVEQLTLKNVPFVDHKVLAGIVEFCPNLQKLEVPGCEQFTLFSVAPFLEFLKDIQEQRGTHIEFDVAPAFYKGGRWMDIVSHEMSNLKSTHDRKGTFGVAESDPGCDIPTALCKLLLHSIFPAIEAAGQRHMIYNYSSLFREWNEALPGPRGSYPLTVACWLCDEQIITLKSTGEREWRAQLPDPQDPLTFERNHWPGSLKEQIVRLETLRHWFIVKATCGENGWKQTADRGFYSCDYQCTAGNFLEHSQRMICDTCDLSLPRIFFNAAETCEGCRLKDRVLHRENDHLQHWKRIATAALGYGETDEPFRTNAESNFPFDAFKRDEDGNLPIKTRSDFVRVINAAPSLRDFIDAAAELEMREQQARYRKGRKTIRQLSHPHTNPPALDATGPEILARQPYRRALTHEEYAKSGGQGWEPANKHGFIKW